MSDNGVLVFDPLPSRQSRRLVWMDRQGQATGTTDGMEDVSQVHLSPDGRRFVVDRADSESGNGELWVSDAAGNTARLTFDPANDQIDPKTRYDVWVLPIGPDGPGKPYPFLQTEANEAAAVLSPDGRWGRQAAGVRCGRQRAAVAQRRQRALLPGADGKLMAAAVKRGTSFAADPPRALFGFRSSGPLITPYFSVAPDGQHFLVSTIVDTAPGAPLSVVLNWTAAIDR